VEREVEKQYSRVQSTWWVALVQAVFNAVSYFANKMAYDMAVSLATASPGQTPSFFTQDWGSYLTDTALNATGEFIGSLSEIWSSTEKEGTCASDPNKSCVYDIDCEGLPGAEKCTTDSDCESAETPGRKCRADGFCAPYCIKETIAELIHLGEIEKWTGTSLRNLCVPPDPQFRLNLLLSLSDVGAPPAPKCEWASIKQQWDTFIQEASTP